MQFIANFLQAAAVLGAQMAPYLLLGFLIAGVLRVFFSEAWVRRHLGQRGLKQILKAVVIGIPLPLCSCGVIPVAASIRRQGGSAGATASFTAATPQTGVDAIAASIGMLGLPFTLVRILIAFINGIVAGLLVERFGKADAQSAADAKPSCCCGDSKAAPATQSCCSAKAAAATAPAPLSERLRAGFAFGLRTLPGDLFTPLLTGILIAAAVATLVPVDFFDALPGGWVSLYALVTLIALPLYVCSTGSLPMAVAFLAAGMSPGAVLIFLIAGPATNAATVTALWSMLGARSAVLYIVSITAIAWASAALIDLSGIALLGSTNLHQHVHGASQLSILQVASGIGLAALCLYAKCYRNR